MKKLKSKYKKKFYYKLLSVEYYINCFELDNWILFLKIMKLSNLSCLKKNYFLYFDKKLIILQFLKLKKFSKTLLK